MADHSGIEPDSHGLTVRPHTVVRCGQQRPAIQAGQASALTLKETRTGFAPDRRLAYRSFPLAGSGGIEPHPARIWNPAHALRYHPHYVARIPYAFTPTEGEAATVSKTSVATSVTGY